MVGAVCPASANTMYPRNDQGPAQPPRRSKLLWTLIGVSCLALVFLLLLAPGASVEIPFWQPKTPVGKIALSHATKELLQPAVFLTKYLEMLDKTWEDVVRPPLNDHVASALESRQGESALFKGVLEDLLAGYFSKSALSTQSKFFADYAAPESEYSNLFEWEQKVETADPVLNVDNLLPELVDEMRSDIWPSVRSQCTSEDSGVRRRGANALMGSIDGVIRAAGVRYAHRMYDNYVTARSRQLVNKPSM